MRMLHNEWRPFPNGCIPGAWATTCAGKGRAAIADIAENRTRSVVAIRNDAPPTVIPIRDASASRRRCIADLRRCGLRLGLRRRLGLARRLRLAESRRALAARMRR